MRSFICRFGPFRSLGPLLALLISAGFSHARAQSPQPDFTGEWILDLEASRSPEFKQIMQEYGLNWFERTAADKITVEQTIEQESNAVLRISIHTFVRDAEEVMHMDGEWREVEDASGRPVHMRSYWSDDGQALIADIVPQAGKYKDLQMKLTRTLSEDGQTMHLEHSLQRGTNAAIRAMRVLRRVNPQ